MQIGLEHPTIVLGSARDDGLQAAIVIAKAAVFAALPRIAIARVRSCADGTLGEHQGTIHRCIGTRYARNAERNGLDAAEVMTWPIHVEQFFGEHDSARSRRAKLHQCDGIYLQQTDMLGQLILTLV